MRLWKLLEIHLYSYLFILWRAMIRNVSFLSPSLLPCFLLSFLPTFPPLPIFRSSPYPHLFPPFSLYLATVIGCSQVLIIRWYVNAKNLSFNPVVHPAVRSYRKKTMSRLPLFSDWCTCYASFAFVSAIQQCGNFIFVLSVHKFYVKCIS